MKTVDQIFVTVGDEPKNNQPHSSDLGNALLTLLSSSKKKKKEEPVDPFYYGDIEEDNKVVEKKEKKKEKKEKKKKSKKGSMVSELDVDVIYGNSILSATEDDEDGDYIEDNNPNQIDIDRVFEDDDFDDDMENIIYDQKRAYKKNKSSDGYVNQFAEELSLLYGLLEETNDFSTDLDKLYKSMLKNSRGFSKNTTELINTILSAKNAKLSVLKEITSVKKTIADLTLKESKNSGDTGAIGSVNTLAASYLNGIIKHGRNNFVNAMNNGGDDDYDQQRSDEIDDFVNRVGDYEDDEEREMLNEEIMESLDSDDKYSRSAASDAYIRNEAREVTVKIERNVGSGEWDFVAVDKNGLSVYDYPLPPKSAVTPVKFTADGAFGTDKYGRSYKVIETI